MIDLAVRKPVNKTAALVASKGEEPEESIISKTKCRVYSLKPPIARGDVNLPKKIDRLEILGFVNRKEMGLIPSTPNNKKPNIATRCDCGNYELKSRKTLVKKGTSKMCSVCADREHIKRKLFYATHGFYLDEL